MVKDCLLETDRGCIDECLLYVDNRVTKHACQQLVPLVPIERAPQMSAVPVNRVELKSQAKLK